jgi:hypothetical protein
MNKILPIILLAFLSGCCCPDPVETKKLGDEKMSCQELIVEMKEIEKARKDLSSEKGVTGKNVAAVVFFWPALIATHSNVNEAVRALDERKNHLMTIYNSKGCQKIVQ